MTRPQIFTSLLKLKLSLCFAIAVNLSEAGTKVQLVCFPLNTPPPETHTHTHCLPSGFGEQGEQGGAEGVFTRRADSALEPSAARRHSITLSVK